MAVGHEGEILLEDYRDIADMMEWSRRVAPRNLWVTERRMMSDADTMRSMFAI